MVAYLLLWAVLLFYVVLLTLRQRRLRDDLADLRRELRQQDEDGSSSRESGP